MESDFQDSNTLEDKVNYYSALTTGLHQLAENEGISSIHVTAGDNTLPGPFYQAAAEVESLGFPGAGDVAIFNELSLTALGAGNHEWDGGADEFCAMLASQKMPYLAVNLDFTNLVCNTMVRLSSDAQECASAGGGAAKSCYVSLDNGLTVGLIGRAPAGFFNVVANPLERLPGLDFVGGRDPDTNQPLLSATPMVLEQVDLLEAAGCDVVILLDHAQDWTFDPFSIETLRGIDVIVQAGGTGFMAGEEDGVFNKMRDGDVPSREYPISQTDMEGNTVLIVDSPQLWTYIGHLIIEFDDDGHIIGYDSRSGPIAATEESVSMLSEYVGADPALTPMSGVVSTITALKETDTVGYIVVGTTEYVLEGDRANIRGRETNLGRIVADSTVWGAQKYLDSNGIDVSVDIALKNGGGIRATISGPDITRIAIQKALAFDNKIAIVRVSVPQLLAIIENSVSRNPAKDGRFPHVAGVSVGFDNEMPGIEAMSELTEISRITNLAVGDTIIVEDSVVVGDLDQSFVIATNTYLTTGGDGYIALAEAESLAETDIGEQQILEDYIQEELGSTVDLNDPPSDPRVYTAKSDNTEDTATAMDATMATDPTAASKSEGTVTATAATASTQPKEEDNAPSSESDKAEETKTATDTTVATEPEASSAFQLSLPAVAFFAGIVLVSFI